MRRCDYKFLFFKLYDLLAYDQVCLFSNDDLLIKIDDMMIVLMIYGES